MGNPNIPIKGDYNTYIGARYIPLIGGMWDKTLKYEPLTIVMYQGSSYTSKTYVPANTDITNTDYWVRTANYDEQVEFYRSEVQQFKKDIDASEAKYIATVQKAQKEFTTTITNQQNNFETSINKRQKEYEDKLTEQENQHINDVTTSQNEYEAKLSNDYSELKNRVNNLVADSGSTDGNTELTDIRVGANGITYDNAGNSVRDNDKFSQSITIEQASAKNQLVGVHKAYAPSREGVTIIDDNGNIGAVFDANTLTLKNYNSGRNVQSGKGYADETSLDKNIYITDANGNVGAKIEEGSVLKGNATPVYGMYYSNTEDIPIVDKNGFIGGYIVKNNNKLGSLSTNLPLRGKKLSILGDSISTYKGVSPNDWNPYYPADTVNAPEKTWWSKLIASTGMTLLKNQSWGGCKVSGDSLGTNGYAGCSTARVDSLADGDTVPDIIICWISTNDWNESRDIGSFTENDPIPSDGTINDIAPAYALMLYKIRNKYPKAFVYCVTNLERVGSSYPDVNADNVTIHTVNHAISEIAHIFGCTVIDLIQCGINYYNISTYTNNNLHPNDLGTTIIASYMKKVIQNSYCEI